MASSYEVSNRLHFLSPPFAKCGLKHFKIWGHGIFFFFFLLADCMPTHTGHWTENNRSDSLYFKLPSLALRSFKPLDGRFFQQLLDLYVNR